MANEIAGIPRGRNLCVWEGAELPRSRGGLTDAAAQALARGSTSSESPKVAPDVCSDGGRGEQF
jgi:hypothetical protein